MKAGTRGSALAMWQTNHVVSLLGGDVDVETITTRGDVDRTSKLQGKLEKGFFTEELEAALREQRIDFAVHSLKDLPTKSPEDLFIGAVLERAPVSDWLLVRAGLPAVNGPLPANARVGASSLRREALLKTWLPGAHAALLRGNVPTRVKKLQSGEYDAIVLAAAGLTRLGLQMDGVKVFELNPHRWVPAPGQGAIAVQCRTGDAKTREALSKLQHAPTARAVHLERELLRIFEGGCTAPFGALVVGAELRAGAEMNGQWRALKREIPSAPGDGYYRDVLNDLSKAGTDDDQGWLYREV
ncbi:MAG: hydroxymethylbilane synthase [Archangiaceae bacterium]|nr:hydroxymethylbilane synthase [Archangiaceae bacterium]